MHSMTIGKRGTRGFTLIEILIVLAVLGVLSAVVVPNVVGFLGRGNARSIETDENTITLAVQSFKGDSHVGVASAQWGKGGKGNLYPTASGNANFTELSTTVFDAAYPSNAKIVKYAAGPTGGADAVDADITSSAVWMGLLKQEPFGTAGTTYAENTASGTAHPMAIEQGQYLKDMAKSASEWNTDTDTNYTNNNGLSKGSYTFVVLDTGDVVAAYKSGAVWYAGYNGSYP